MKVRWSRRVDVPRHDQREREVRLDQQYPETAASMDSNCGPTDGCGCIIAAPSTAADPSPLATGPDETSSASPDGSRAVSRAGPPRRLLKLVVTLHPVAGAGYRASVAVGSADCDPLVRVRDVPDVATALAEVAPLLVEAETRWKTQPRYPNVRPAPRIKPRSEPEHAAAESTMTTASPAPPAEPHHLTASATPAKSSGQLPLFG